MASTLCFARRWFVLSPRTIPLTALVSLGAVVSRLATGSWQYLPGGAGGAFEVVCGVLLPAALVTEVIKIAGGMQVRRGGAAGGAWVAPVLRSLGACM
jgi:hypothetical protein